MSFRAVRPLFRSTLLAARRAGDCGDCGCASSRALSTISAVARRPTLRAFSRSNDCGDCGCDSTRSVSTLIASRRAPSTLSSLARANDCGDCGCDSTRGFSSTSIKRGSGETDSTLSSALAAEHKYEVESASTQPEVPAFIETVKAQGIWEIEDIPGFDDVSFTRKFGNETIKLTFQVSDLDASSLDGEFPAAEGEESEAAPAGPASIACSLSITKQATPGALVVDLETCDEGFEITNVAVYEKSLAEATGCEGDWDRRSRYMGPQFEHLDEAVQEAFGSYLAERGVDETLADFVLSYCEHKEQKDYVSWLQQVQKFVEQ